MNGTIPDFYADKIAQAFQETENERLMYVRFNGLNGRIEKDGNKWCAITGQMPEHYVAGFGDSPAQSVYEWHSEFYKPIKHNQ
jgi:hypothetical protein